MKENNQTVLLTGGAGYIGSHTCVSLILAGYSVVIADNLSNSSTVAVLELMEHWPEKIQFCEMDICRTDLLKKLMDDHKVAAVIHFAAMKSVRGSFDDPVGYAHNNISGLLSVLCAMDTSNIAHIVYSSSAAVYSDTNTPPLKEDDQKDYKSPYAYSKLVGEQLLDYVLTQSHAWKIGQLRYFNPVGASSLVSIGEEPMQGPESLVPTIAQVAAGNKRYLSIFGGDYDTPDGTCIRDYIHIEDLARGHVLSLEYLLFGGGSHKTNLGTGRGHSVLEVLEAYEKACGAKIPYLVESRRPGDIARSFSDPARAKEVLGFSAKKSLEEMCKSDWDWTKTVLARKNRLQI